MICDAAGLDLVVLELAARAGPARADPPRHGGSSGIGLETARLARAKGADIILTARNPDRLHRPGLELRASIAAFDATDFDRLERFFDALPTPIGHLLVTGPGSYYAPLAESDPDAARRDVDAQLLLRYRSLRTPRARFAREAPYCS